MLDEIINYVQSLQQQVEVCCYVFSLALLQIAAFLYFSGNGADSRLSYSWWDHTPSFVRGVIGRRFPITDSVSFSIGFWPSPCNLFILFYSLLMLFGVISGWVCMGANIVGMYTSFIHPTLTFVFFLKMLI